ncbi:MAG: ABC transporter ATP-binding protein/permease [Polyangiaceae bacterium]|nr:ABC transporter ATP-binding protein/permease [Polyangiaceae bacterium]
MREFIAILTKIRRSLRGTLAGKLAAAIALATLSGATAGLLPSVVGLAIDAILGRTRPAGAPGGGLFAGLLDGAPTWQILVATLVTTLVTVGVSVLSSQRGSALSGEVTAALRIEMLRSVLCASPREVEARGRAAIESKGGPPPPPGVKLPEARGMEVVKLAIAREAGLAADFTVAFLMGLPQAVVTLLVLGIELVSGGMGLVFAGGAALFGLSRVLADRASKRVASEMASLQRADVAVFSTLGEVLAATEDLRLLGARGQAAREFAEAAYRTADAKRAFAGALAVAGQIKSVFSALSPLLVVAAVSFSNTGTPAGEVAKLLLVVPLLMARLESLDALRTGLIERGPVLRATVGLLDLPEYPPAPSDPVDLDKVAGGSIAFENVKYAPEGASRPIIDGLSLTIPEGSIVGICGRSGCGKSTLLRLLLRLDEPSSGTIKIDGVDVKRLRSEDLPRAFGVLGQASRLLERSVADNLALGLSTPPGEAAMREALRRVELGDFAQEGGGGRGLHTEYRAVPPSFSGGEQRRLLLARMLLRAPRIFVLDEPEAGLPSATAEELLRAVAEVAGGRTCVVVTHAPHLLRSTFNVVMDGGKIAATGTHDELAATSDLYRSLLAEGLKRAAARPPGPFPGAPPGAAPPGMAAPGISPPGKPPA